MSVEFSMTNLSQPNSQSAGSDIVQSFKPVSMFTSNDDVNLFQRAQKSGFPGLSDSKSRTMLYSVVGGKKFSNFMLLIVLLNTLNMVFQSSKPFSIFYSYYLSVFDSICLGMYIMEMLMKIFVFRSGYFKSGWNIFDVVIVSLSVISTLIPIIAVSFAGSGASKLKVLTTFKVFKVLKAIRALRVLRTISFLKSLQVVVATLLRSIPALSSIVGLAVLILVIFAVTAKSLYGDVDPDNLGTVGDAVFSLLFAISLDQWSDLWQRNEPKAPSIGYFLALFVFIENFVILNVFVAVLVSNLETARKKVKKEFKAAERVVTDSEDSAEVSSDSSTSSSLKFTTIEEYHPDLSIKYKQLVLFQNLYEELTLMDETFYLFDQQNRILNSLLVKD